MQQYYHISKRALRIGAVLTQGMYGEQIKNLKPEGQKYQLHLKESIFEDVRKSYFPHAPSRLDCSFLLPNLETAQAYRAYSMGYETYLYEIEIQEGKAFHVEMAWHRRVGPQFQDIKEHAKQYWLQIQHENSLSTEALLDGKAIVKAAILQPSNR